jgi:H+/Cl- antiporter ClcA
VYALNYINQKIRYYAKWVCISAVVGALCGVASAVFLAALELATHTRETHIWLLYFLPLGGLIVGGVYHRYGRRVERGNNLIIDEFHEPKAVIPFRMTPLVLFGTLATHLFGGSAGREGTAVQMGGSIADQFAHFFKMNHDERRTLLMAGMSGGFGSVFGVPFAGTVFGLEVLSVGRINLWALVECAISAFAAHYTTLALGIRHTNYVHPFTDFEFTTKVGLYMLLAGAVFGLAAKLFSFLALNISTISKKLVPFLPARAFLGGALIAAIYFLWPTTTRYSGLGVSIIVDSLKEPLPQYDWLAKLIFTTLTLGVGFKGGEVTPLLFVGATLGNALSSFMPIPLPILAAMGFVGVFAGAANTPFACTFMAMELFGPQVGPYVAIACFVSYALSGPHGIYHAQRFEDAKHVFGRRLKFLKFIFKRPN